MSSSFNKSENAIWVYHRSDESNLEKDKCGKWMYFFDDKNHASRMCEEAIRSGIVTSSKHSNAPTGVACFYLNSGDAESHKKVLLFFVKNKMIRKTKGDTFYDISFKLDSQTRKGEYQNKSNFVATLKLSTFIDLGTGKLT